MKARNGDRYLKQGQLDYIRENYHKLTIAMMAGAIGASHPIVWYACHKRLKVRPVKNRYKDFQPEIPIYEPY